MTSRTDNVETPKWTPSIAHTDQVDPLRTMIFQALGAASMCWEHIERAGVFDSDRALWIGESVMAWLEEHGHCTPENVETSCTTCAGSGVIDANHFGDRMMIEPCVNCDGTGRVSTPENVDSPSRVDR